MTKWYLTCLWHEKITGFKLLLVMTENNPPILENVLTPAPSVLLGQKNNWLLLTGINWSAIVKSFTRQNWYVKYQCSSKWMSSKMFCLKRNSWCCSYHSGRAVTAVSVMCSAPHLPQNPTALLSNPASLENTAASALLCQASLEMHVMGVSSGSPCVLS